MKSGFRFLLWMTTISNRRHVIFYVVWNTSLYESVVIGNPCIVYFCADIVLNGEIWNICWPHVMPDWVIPSPNPVASFQIWHLNTKQPQIGCCSHCVSCGQVYVSFSHGKDQADQKILPLVNFAHTSHVSIFVSIRSQVRAGIKLIDKGSRSLHPPLILRSVLSLVCVFLPFHISSKWLLPKVAGCFSHFSHL